MTEEIVPEVPRVKRKYTRKVLTVAEQIAKMEKHKARVRKEVVSAGERKPADMSQHPAQKLFRKLKENGVIIEDPKTGYGYLVTTWERDTETVPGGKVLSIFVCPTMKDYNGEVIRSCYKRFGRGGKMVMVWDQLSLNVGQAQGVGEAILKLAGESGGIVAAQEVKNEEVKEMIAAPVLEDKLARYGNLE